MADSGTNTYTEFEQLMLGNKVSVVLSLCNKELNFDQSPGARVGMVEGCPGTVNTRAARS